MKNRFYLFVITSLSLFYSLKAFGHGVSETDKQAMLNGGFLEYIFLGAKHMVTGYDHLLFLFGVIFFLTQFKEIVKFITLFTAGHCITLIFATFMGITANAYLVDAVIALTVIYKGFDNLDGFKKYLKIQPPNLLILVFIFGLIHGFGLSTRLQELPLNPDRLLMDILAFNIGVETGQIAALSIMMVLLAGWRKTTSFSKFSFMSNLALIFAGLWLLGTQLHGYSHDHGHHEDDKHIERVHQEEAKEVEAKSEVTQPPPDNKDPHSDAGLHKHDSKKPAPEPKLKKTPPKHKHKLKSKHKHGDHTHEH